MLPGALAAPCLRACMLLESWPGTDRVRVRHVEGWCVRNVCVGIAALWAGGARVCRTAHWTQSLCVRRCGWGVAADAIQCVPGERFWGRVRRHLAVRFSPCGTCRGHPPPAAPARTDASASNLRYARRNTAAMHEQRPQAMVSCPQRTHSGAASAHASRRGDSTIRLTASIM